jgi:hypothetical protein
MQYTKAFLYYNVQLKKVFIYIIIFYHYVNIVLVLIFPCKTLGFNQYQDWAETWATRRG